MTRRPSVKMYETQRPRESTRPPALRCSIIGTEYVARCQPHYSRFTGCVCEESPEAYHRFPPPRIKIRCLICFFSLLPSALWCLAANALGEVSGHLRFKK